MMVAFLLAIVIGSSLRMTASILLDKYATVGNLLMAVIPIPIAVLSILLGTPGMHIGTGLSSIVILTVLAAGNNIPIYNKLSPLLDHPVIDKRAQ